MQNIPDAKLQSEVKAFVENVSREVELAFRDVFNILREIAELPGDRVNQDTVTGLQQKLVNTYAKDEFKNVKKICERLDECSKRYAAEIEPHLQNTPFGPDSHSELFWLLNKHEGAFIYTIKNAVHEISDSLAAFEHPADYRAIYWTRYKALW